MNATHPRFACGIPCNSQPMAVGKEWYDAELSMDASRTANQRGGAAAGPAQAQRPDRSLSTEPFRPVPEEGIAAEQPVALSTYVRPRGSMAGRGVLRAAGVSMNPYSQWARPAYAGPGRSLPMARRCRVR